MSDAAQDRGCLSEQAPDTVSGGGTPGTSSAATTESPTDQLLAAAEWFIECAYPPGAKYEVGKRFLFWQARSNLKDALAAVKEAESRV